MQSTACRRSNPRIPHHLANSHAVYFGTGGNSRTLTRAGANVASGERRSWSRQSVRNSSLSGYCPMDQSNDIQSTTDIEQTLDAVESVIGQLQAAGAGSASHSDADGHSTEPTSQSFGEVSGSSNRASHPGPFVGYQTDVAAKAALIDEATGGTGLTAATPTPPPKRPKGRLVIGTFLMGLLLAGLYIVWDGLFRYEAYGIVAADRIAIPSPTTGIIRRVCVTDGDFVRAGEVLVVVHDLKLEHELERTRDQLRLAEAQLDAHVSDLRSDALKRSVLQKWDIHDNAAELFELASSLRQHRTEADRLERDFTRKQELHRRDVATEEQLDRVLFALQGERELIEQLDRAVNELKKRQAILPPEESVDFNQISPALVQIENLQQETQRLTEQLRQSRIVAPVSGTIVQHGSVVGCRVVPDQVLLEIIQQGTTEPVVYFSQNDTRHLSPGDELAVHVHPYEQPLLCRVNRIGEEYTQAPLSIERFYSRNEPLLPVTLTPPAGIVLKSGAMVQLPHAL